jgi:hypothetical protein
MGCSAACKVPINWAEFGKLRDQKAGPPGGKSASLHKWSGMIVMCDRAPRPLRWLASLWSTSPATYATIVSFCWPVASAPPSKYTLRPPLMPTINGANTKALQAFLFLSVQKCIKEYVLLQVLHNLLWLSSNPIQEEGQCRGLPVL